MRSSDDKAFNDAATEIFTALKEGRDPVLPEGVTYHLNRGPSSEQCNCNCPDGKCGHKWDGPWRELPDGGTATCSICGMGCDAHDMWVMP